MERRRMAGGRTDASVMIKAPPPQKIGNKYLGAGRHSSFPIDVLVFCAGLAMFYGLLWIGRMWVGPFTPSARISTSVWALPAYSAYSLMRVLLAYGISLIFALGYGYVAAYNPKAERIMIPLLDILQSIPVLSFLPGVMVAMVALFPHSQLGVELGSILLIFTGQVWNIAFSFYSSLKSIPKELHEVSRVYRFSNWQRFTQLELPHAAIGLVWNSMMSVAGGWFFLMACEMFVLGQRDFRLPGLGSYLNSAANRGDMHSILLGLSAMIGIILLLDQLAWRPLLVWADKFKLEQVESAIKPSSRWLSLLRSSRILGRLRSQALSPAAEAIGRYCAKNSQKSPVRAERTLIHRGLWYLLSLALAGILAFGFVHVLRTLSEMTLREFREILSGAGATFLRVNVALIIGALWTIPAGVAIGTSPKLARFAQPVAQIAASVPATALFPVILLALMRVGGGLGSAAIVLMLLGTQWYILFNVIAGAMALPTDLKEVTQVFRFGTVDRWRRLILPAIFPYLITGMVTASGGAWNASVVAEYFHFKGRILSTTGLGAIISHATDSGNLDQLLGATLVMSVLVVMTNRLVWRRFYHLAETRFKLSP